MSKILSFFQKLFFSITVLIILLSSAIFIVPSILGYKPYSVLTGSMTDIYPVGSLIYVHKTSFEDLNTGDIITYTRGSTTITHRITDIYFEDRTVRTKGDNNNTYDSIVSFSDINGKSTGFSIPYAGALMSNTSVKYTIVIVFLLSAVVFYLKK